ncbi:hypothetical protein NQ315_001189 [Exocentrus adspersus]|uniref:Uncharacterized protein n=1 Tax=Exocentrus adspersus TaxID=1586481 RepID=A0AAV8WF91_9CUCU|nr:hypothetical protein NQ315_001189 [Exocentrus adspersus]
MFTSHTHVQTKVFLPSVLQNDMTADRVSSPFKPVSPVPKELTKEEMKRKSANLEEALDELEAIYNSLRLGDEDLLERAEQREKETQAKKLLDANIDPYPGCGGRGTLSDSGFSYEPFDTVDSPKRKKLFKRNKTADVKHDDMAFRKMHKDRAATISDPQSVIAKVSYLLASPVHAKDEQSHDVNGEEPDTTYDDVVYRNVKHAKKIPKVIEPQPPFGIPLGPIAPAANSDYLHAKPEDTIYRPLYKSRKIPDIVKDDLAFRNLRKDNSKEPALPPLSAEDFKNNNSSPDNAKLDLNYLKKKRAQRSLSANIGSLIHEEIIEKARNRRTRNNDVDNEFKTLTDIADAMEIARKVLREKDNKISATRKAFMSDTDTKYVQPVSNAASLRENRLNFLNGLKTSTKLGDDIVSSKPPRGLTPERKARSPKESTPIPISPLEDKRSTVSGSTSSSLEDLLNALAEEAKETTERITNELKMLGEEKQKRTNVDSKDLLSEIDAVSEHAKKCEKLLESVVDSNELMASTKTPEEEVKQIQVEAAQAESANVVLSRVGSKEERREEKDDSEHDYENLVSDKELNVDEVDIPASVEEPEGCRSPFEEHKAELVATFQELKQNMESIDLPSKGEHCDEAKDEEGVTGEKECAVALPVKECASLINTNTDRIFVSNCDIVLSSANRLDDDSENSSGFHSNCSCGEGSSSNYLKCCSNNLDSLESLKSPKLVLELDTSTKALSKNETPAAVPTSSRLVLEATQANRGDPDDDRHILDDDAEKPTPSWYRDPATMALACSYGIACAHQLASVDVFAILSILFAVISFIAAMFL